MSNSETVEIDFKGSIRLVNKCDVAKYKEIEAAEAKAKEAEAKALKANKNK